MNWFYAEGGSSKGPVDDDVFQSLVASGAIGPGTLVWREGMSDWLPYASVFPHAAPAAAPGTPPIPPAPATAAEWVVCSECARTVPAADTLRIAGRIVCAACKPRVVQQLVEGADAAGATTFNPDVLLARLRERGGCKLMSVDAAGRAFDLVKARFWPCVGVTALVYLILGVASRIPCVNIIAQCVLATPLMGGLYVYFLRQLRGKPATLNDAFCGFKQPLFKELALCGTIKFVALMVLVVGCVVPITILSVGSAGFRGDPDFDAMMLVIAGPAVVVAAFVGMIWFPSTIIIADKGIGFWPAMELSRKLVFMSFGGWLVFFIVGVGIALLGLLALCVGLFVAAPVFAAMVAVTWDDILRRAGDATASVAA
jgi:hypothetical protein